MSGSVPASQVQALLSRLSNYFDIDNILAQETNIPATFLTTVPDLLPNFNVKANKETYIPLWLAEALVFRKDTAILGRLHQYKDTFRIAATSSPADANLSKYNYYYDLGIRLSHIYADKELLDDLLTIAIHRFRNILPEFLQSPGPNNVGTLRGESGLLGALCETEKRILDTGRMSRSEVMEWLRSGRIKRNHEFQ
ncbi:hypothetical protein RCL1_003159 [Eukaryota sp. TZLM3-RCL]